MTLSLFYWIQRLLVETHTNFELVLLDTTTTRGDTYRAYIFIQPLFMETTTQFYLIQRYAWRQRRNLHRDHEQCYIYAVRTKNRDDYILLFT